MLQTYEKTKSPDIQGKADIEFRKITSFPRGTLYSLLRDAYSFEKKFERDCFNQWREFDDFFTIIRILQIHAVLSLLTTRHPSVLFHGIQLIFPFQRK